MVPSQLWTVPSQLGSSCPPRTPQPALGNDSIAVCDVLGASLRGNSSCFPSRLVVLAPATNAETQLWTPEVGNPGRNFTMKLFLTKLPLPCPGGEKERVSERCTLGSADQIFLQCVSSAPSHLPPCRLPRGSVRLCSSTPLLFATSPRSHPPRVSRHPTNRKRALQEPFA